MSAREKIIKIGLPFFILLAGIAGMMILSSLRQPPHKKIMKETEVPVEVLPARLTDHRARIFATGTVQAARRASIAPQVSGRVTWMSPQLVAGGVFKKGQLLLEIERGDYELAVEQARAALSKAELDLETVKGKADVAREEWKRLSSDTQRKPSPLLLYEPQLKNARAEVASAKATLEQAELNLRRTRLYAPFNCAVQSEEVETGQYVRAGDPIATVIGTDRAEILVPIPLEDLEWVDVPASGHGHKGSRAQIYLKAGNMRFTWIGRVDRILKDVDPLGRMPRIIVTVSHPFQRSTKHTLKTGLASGLFVNLEIRGKVLHHVYLIPTIAMRENNTIWIADRNNRLHIQPVTVLRREKEDVLVKADFPQGTRIILTKISGAAEGLRIKPVNRMHTP